MAFRNDRRGIGFMRFSKFGGAGARIVASVSGAVLLAAGAIFAGSGLAAPAHAGGLSGEGGLFGSGDLNLQAGGIVVVRPKYEGSDQYEVTGAPIVAPAGYSDGGLVQFKGIDDVRFRLLNLNGFEAGPVAGYRFGRDEDDADRLTGLGDVDGGLILGGFAAYRVGPFAAFASYGHQVGGDDTGGQLRFGGESRFMLSPVLAVTATIGATWADDDYMGSYFGVTAAQSARSGLAAYDADAGVKDVYFGLASDVALDDRWTLKLTGRYSRLIGDAADSPIVESEDQFMGGLGLTYKFSIPR